MLLPIRKRIDIVFVVALEKIIFAIAAGFVVWLIPILQHWLIYILWSPVLGCTFAWLYSEVRDHTQPNPKWKSSIGTGIAVALTHIIATSLVWVAVTKILPPPPWSKMRDRNSSCHGIRVSPQHAELKKLQNPLAHPLDLHYIRRPFSRSRD